MIDLHLHSSFSDGLDTPTQLIEHSLNLNLKAISLTDHDSIDGLREFLSYGEERGIITIPGVEISIRHEPSRQIKDVHVIGLNIDHNSSELIKTLKLQSEGRLRQKQEICKRLREEFGYEITFEEIKAIAGNNSVGRPHIVEVLTRNNSDKIRGKSKNDLFKMISLGGSAHVHRDFELSLEESIDLIINSGGIPILAHPGIYEVKDLSKLIKTCIDAGIKGIEVEYTYSKNRPYYKTDKEKWAQEFFPRLCRSHAEKFGLIKSGGSDYHGGKKGIKIGEANVPDCYLKNFI